MEGRTSHDIRLLTESMLIRVPWLTPLHQRSPISGLITKFLVGILIGIAPASPIELPYTAGGQHVAVQMLTQIKERLLKASYDFAAALFRSSLWSPET